MNHGPGAMVIVIGGTKHARENKVKSGSKNRCFCRMADWAYIGQRLDKSLKFVQILFKFCAMLVKNQLLFKICGSKFTDIHVSVSQPVY